MLGLGLVRRIIILVESLPPGSIPPAPGGGAAPGGGPSAPRAPRVAYLNDRDREDDRGRDLDRELGEDPQDASFPESSSPELSPLPRSENELNRSFDGDSRGSWDLRASAECDLGPSSPSGFREPRSREILVARVAPERHLRDDLPSRGQIDGASCRHLPDRASSRGGHDSRERYCGSEGCGGTSSSSSESSITVSEAAGGDLGTSVDLGVAVRDMPNIIVSEPAPLESLPQSLEGFSSLFRDPRFAVYIVQVDQWVTLLQVGVGG